MTKIRPLLLAFTLLLSLNSLGQVRKYSNEFLSIGVGARALGMANSTVASTSDITSGYWNPAGLTGIESNIQFGLMHSEYFAGIAKFDYGGIAIPLKDKNRILAFSLIRFAVDDIANTLFLFEPDGSINYDNIRTFSMADYALLLSYAQPIKWKDVKIGGNVKIIHRDAGTFASAWGFGIDLGAQMKHKNWRFGVMARDITTTFNAWSFSFTDEEQQALLVSGNVIPENSYEITAPRLILGAGYEFKIKKFSILPEVNLDVTTDGRRNVLVSAEPFSIDPHAGIELGFDKFVFIRGGVGNIQKVLDFDGSLNTVMQPNLGIGIQIRNIGIDYAYTDIGNQAESRYSHVFSLKVDINQKESP